MRQHAIPQNVLDVEFKLFTKFTLKEFAYLALGIGFGGLILYLTIGETIPAIIGIPVFLLSSAAGIFLGLVPINDQDADKFIQSYITAITNPTQRAWHSKKTQKSAEKPEIKPTKEGTLVPKGVKVKKSQIIGAGITPRREIDENIEDKDMLDREIDVPAKEAISTKAIDPNHIVITDENISSYQFKTEGMDNLPGNINLWLSTKEFKPIPNVIVYLKNKEDKVVYANKTGPNGYFLTTQLWKPEKYTIELSHTEYTFPKVDILLTEKTDRLPIKINSLN